MGGPNRPRGDGKAVTEVDYIERIVRSLTDSSTSQAALSQSTDHSHVVDSGMGSSSYSFDDSWGFFPPPLPEVGGLVADSSEPSWRTGSLKDLSPIQREILADFPWLSEELDHRRLIPSTSVASKEESDACTSVRPTDQVAWAESMLGHDAFENSTMPEECPPVVGEKSKAVRQLQSLVRFSQRSTSATPETPFNSESLSSSLSDGEAQAAGTSGRSGKRKRPEQEDGEDAPSDDQETKKPINRPRKKGVKRVREPRYAIKTRTDTEVMDDGYKWRKYGQKAVKNSPHPRNYYRCTIPNCPVRKRVERCCDDPGLVVTTYEGTHTHQSPSFLRGPPDYQGGLQGLLATLSHHYSLAGNAPLPPFASPTSAGTSAPPLSDLYGLSQLQSPARSSATQEDLHPDLHVLRAHEQLLRLRQQEAAAQPGRFQFPGQGPSFSSVSSLSDLSYNTRMSRYDSLANSSTPDRPSSQITTPFEFSSLISTGTAGPFSSGLPDQSTGASNDSGLLQDMLEAQILPVPELDHH